MGIFNNIPGVRDDIMITRGYEKVDGVVTEYCYVRWCPLETPRFRFGLGFEWRTTDIKRAQEYAKDISDYINAVIENEIKHNKPT